MIEKIVFWIACKLMRRKMFFIAVNEALLLGGMHVHKNPKKVKK